MIRILETKSIYKVCLRNNVRNNIMLNFRNVLLKAQPIITLQKFFLSVILYHLFVMTF